MDAVDNYFEWLQLDMVQMHARKMAKCKTAHDADVSVVRYDDDACLDDVEHFNG